MTDDLPAKIDVLHTRMTTMEAALAKVSDALVTIARIEERVQANNDALGRAFSSVQSLTAALRELEASVEGRMRKLEEAAPVQKLVSGWILAWIAGAVGLLGGIVIHKILGAA